MDPMLKAFIERSLDREIDLLLDDPYGYDITPEAAEHVIRTEIMPMIAAACASIGVDVGARISAASASPDEFERLWKILKTSS